MPQFIVTIEKGGKETMCVVEADDADSAYYIVDAMDMIKPPCLVSVEPYSDDDEVNDEEE